MERNCPQCTLLNWQCEVQTTSSETLLESKVFLQAWKVFHASILPAKVTRKSPKGPTLRFLLSHVDTVGCTRPLKGLVLLSMVMLPTQQLLGNNGNYTAASLSPNSTVINLCHCSSIRGYDSCSKKKKCPWKQQFQFWLWKITSAYFVHQSPHLSEIM